MSRVVVRMGNVLEGAADLTVLPASAKGTVSSWTRSLAQLHGIPLPRPSRLGSVSDLLPYPGDPTVTRFVVYAASVLNDYSSTNSIQQIGSQLGSLASQYPDLLVIEAPLLGTGAGGLMTEDAAWALISGFKSTAPNTATLFVCVADRERYNPIAEFLQQLDSQDATENRGRLQRSAMPTNESRVDGLSGQQKRELCTALESAFTLSTLEQMVSFRLNAQLESIARSDSLRNAVYDLVVWAEKMGKIEALVDGARQENSANPFLNAFASSLPSE